MGFASDLPERIPLERAFFGPQRILDRFRERVERHNFPVAAETLKMLEQTMPRGFVSVPNRVLTIDVWDGNGALSTLRPIWRWFQDENPGTPDIEADLQRPADLDRLRLVYSSQRHGFPWAVWSVVSLVERRGYKPSDFAQIDPGSLPGVEVLMAAILHHRWPKLIDASGPFDRRLPEPWLGNLAISVPAGRLIPRLSVTEEDGVRTFRLKFENDVVTNRGYALPEPYALEQGWASLAE